MGPEQGTFLSWQRAPLELRRLSSAAASSPDFFGFSCIPPELTFKSNQIPSDHVLVNSKSDPLNINRNTRRSKNGWLYWTTPWLKFCRWCQDSSLSHQGCVPWPASFVDPVYRRHLNLFSVCHVPTDKRQLWYKANYSLCACLRSQSEAFCSWWQ